MASTRLGNCGSHGTGTPATAMQRTSGGGLRLATAAVVVYG